MALATDGQGNFLTLDPGGKWAPAQRAKNDAGDEVIYDGEAWKPVPGASAPQSTATPLVDEYGRVMPAASLSTAPNEAAGRVGNAIVEGYRNTPDILTPAARDAVNSNSGPLGVIGGAMGRFIVNPLLDVAGAGLKGMGAVTSGASQAVIEGANAMGVPALGRDINMLAQVAPAAAMPGFTGYRMPSMEVKPNALTPKFVSERTAPPREPGMTDLDRATQLIQHDNAEQAGVSLPVERGSVGAASNANVSNLTPQQAAEYGSTADKQWLYKSMHPGETDATEYVPGITPTMAQREQTVTAARETKTQRNLSPMAAQAEAELLDEHNTTRKAFFQETAGSDVTQGIAERAADEAINRELAAAFRNGGNVDPTPVTSAIQAELDAPSGKLPPVRAVMKTITDALEKADGTGPETDPRQVYGVRRVINFLQSKRGLVEHPAYGDLDVQAALIRIKQSIDQAIEPVAPGFRKAISDYSEAQRAIEANEAMQTAEAKLYDTQGRMQFVRFHNFMKDVIKSRDPSAPRNPYQSLDETQMTRLKSLHDDLMRVASADDLAKARGSDTTPSMMDAVKEAAKGGGGTLASGVAGAVLGGPLGAIAGPLMKTAAEGVFSRRAERAATQRMNQLLRPDSTQYPTRPNTLGPS